MPWPKKKEQGKETRSKNEGSIQKEHLHPAASGKPVGETEMCSHYQISQNFSQPGFSNLIRIRRQGAACTV